MVQSPICPHLRSSAMSIQRIEPGPRMSQAVAAGNLVYLSGQVGAPGQSVAEQTRTALSEVDRLLASAGTDKSQLLHAAAWLADISGFIDVKSVGQAWIEHANPPARAGGDSKLAAPAHKVEIIIAAARAWRATPGAAALGIAMPQLERGPAARLFP